MVPQSYDGKKEKIVSIATDLFSRYPYHKVSMDTIAKKAGVAKGTLYYHYKSKEELYASLLHEGLDSLLKRVKAEYNRKTTEEKLKGFIDELIRFFNENREFFLVLQREEGKLLNKRLKNCYEKICTVKEILISLIKEGTSKGIFKNTEYPEFVAEIILGMIKSPVIEGAYGKEFHSKIITTILFNGIQGGTHV